MSRWHDDLHDKAEGASGQHRNALLMLATTDSKVLEVAMDSGFGSLSQFHDVFRKITGRTPREYSRTNKA